MLKIFLFFTLLPSLLFAATSSKCPGQNGYFYTNDKSKRNPRKGGFVSEGANVGDYVFIAPTAAVCDSASVLKFARVYGNAIIKGEAEVTDKARVYGDAIVSGEAVISGEAKVSGHAHISGSAEVKGKSWMKGHFMTSKGTYAQGKFSAKPTNAFKAKQAKLNQQAKAVLNSKTVEEARNRLKWIQNDLKQGWYGTNKREGFYRSFKWRKSDVKAPCGFYLKLNKEEKVLDSHCKNTKRVKRKRWVPGKSDYKLVKNCSTKTENQGEKYFDFKKLKVKTHHDFSNNRVYLDFNSYFFYIGNDRKTKEYADKLKDFARKYCGFRG